MTSPEIERLIQLLSKLPGLGPRSARRAVLALVRRRETLLQPLARALTEAADTVRICSTCGNIDSRDPCAICADGGREGHLICVVEDVADLWALERTHAYKGRYHVLGGTLSALDGVTPDDLNIPALVARASEAALSPIEKARTDLEKLQQRLKKSQDSLAQSKLNGDEEKVIVALESTVVRLTEKVSIAQQQLAHASLSAAH